MRFFVINSFSKSFIILLLSLLSACDETIERPKPITPTVRLETVTASKTLVQRRFTGRIDATSTINLSFQVSGHLSTFSIEEGRTIAKGRLIAALDTKDYQLSIQQAKTELHQNQLDVTRKRNLFSSGSLPKAMLDQAETTYKLSKIKLKTAQTNLSYTQIIAPFDALISQRLVDNFTNVNAHQPIIRIQKLTELRVKINIPETMVKLLDAPENFQAEAIFKDRPKQRFPLHYRKHITEAGTVAQTYEVIFGLSRKNNQHVLPGMTVIVIITQKQTDDNPQISIPISAINYDPQGDARVWIFNPQTQTVTAQTVILGEMKKQKIGVISGLQDGEEIVTAGAHLLREGIAVRRFISF